MRRIRVIPVLLIHKGGLYKTVKFSKPQYVGDPINAVRIFNEKEVDEIIILDIDATAKNKAPNIRMIEEIASEAFMPLAYGGGIRKVSEIKEILQRGAEKVVINYGSLEHPELIENAAAVFGSQSIVVSIDIKKNLFGRYKTTSINGTRTYNTHPTNHARNVEKLGAGEIMLTIINREGTFLGYDLDAIKMISDAVNIPVIANGGAKEISDFKKAIEDGHASAVAAGSMFVFKGPRRAVLVNYPSQQSLLADIYSKLN